MSLAVENLELRYGRRVAVSDVTCHASPGAITVVVGPNASGKSTLLTALAGLKRPSAGRVLLKTNGEQGKAQSVHAMSPRRRAHHLAFVSQRPTVAARFTVGQVLELGRYALPTNPSAIPWAMEMIGLPSDLSDEIYGELSVGQQQQVAVVRALAQMAPPEREGASLAGRYLILDEPTAALDLRLVGAVVSALRSLAQAGATIVMALHDLTRASQIGDEAWLLGQGRLVAAGPCREVLAADALSNVFGCGFRSVQDGDGSTYLLPASL